MIKKKSEVLSMLLQNSHNLAIKDSLKKNNRLINIKYLSETVSHPDSMLTLRKEELKVYDYQELQNLSNVIYVPAIISLSKKDLLLLGDYNINILVCSWDDTNLGNILLLPTSKHLLVESHISKIEKSNPINIFYLENAVCLIRDSFIGGWLFA